MSFIPDSKQETTEIKEKGVEMTEIKGIAGEVLCCHLHVVTSRDHSKIVPTIRFSHQRCQASVVLHLSLYNDSCLRLQL